MLRDRKVYVPRDKKLRAEVIRLHHDMPVGGHEGQWKMTELVTKNFWWPGVTKEVKMSQTSFGYISIKSSLILTVLTATESP